MACLYLLIGKVILATNTILTFLISFIQPYFIILAFRSAVISALSPPHTDAFFMRCVAICEVAIISLDRVYGSVFVLSLALKLQVRLRARA